MMKNKYNCILVDDELKAIELLADTIKELYNNIEISGTYSSWQTALPAIKKDDFDLLFIDINMPGKTGIDIITLAPNLKCEVIFVTAHSEFALKAFEHQAAGYILKPIDDTILVKTVDKALERISLKRNQQGNLSSKALIGIPNNKGVDYFSPNDILYFEAKNRYTKVVTQTSEMLSSYSIGVFKEMVEGNPHFYQIHRSFIINVNFIKRYQKDGTILLSNGHIIPISKNERRDFLSHFDNLQ